MMIRFLLFAMLVIASFEIFGVNKITGTITDVYNDTPIEYVTVYINGTTNGTITDKNGSFTLTNIQFPSLLVLSHISYKTHIISLNSPDQALVNIKLIPKEVIISEIDVNANDLHLKNLAYFKDLFLGNDVWGKYATIENVNDLYFCKDYESVEIDVKDDQYYFLTTYAKDITWNDDSSKVTFKREINFKATSLAPVKVNLPLLGYTLFVDLIYLYSDFNTDYNQSQCTFLGYYYFQETKQKSKRDSTRVNKNRVKAYYNSSQHFLKSLYDNKLKENGYLVFEKIPGNVEISDIDLADLNAVISYEGEKAQIIGQKDKKYKIAYYQKSEGHPLNLTKYKGYKPIFSEIVFCEDTCSFNANGIVPDVTIMFNKSIGNKKVGAMLPENYIPADLK